MPENDFFFYHECIDKVISVSARYLHEDVDALKELNDEQLLILNEHDCHKALSVLNARYFAKRFHYLKSALQNRPLLIDSWAVNRSFFRAIMRAVKFYSWRAAFSTFFVSVFRNEFVREMGSNKQTHYTNVLSINESIFINLEDETTLEESISDPDSSHDPVASMNYSELTDSLFHVDTSKHDKYIPDVAALLMEGYCSSEISRSLHISLYRVGRIMEEMRIIVRAKIEGVSEEEIEQGMGRKRRRKRKKKPQ